MRKRNFTLLAGLLLAIAAIGSASGATLIIGDDYNVTGSGSGFILGNGVNSGINPPTTRLTGLAAPNLRYFKAYGVKADTAHYITNNTKLGISRVGTDSSTLSLSTGSGSFDFSPALNTLAATPSKPAVYELTINIANAAAGVQRCSFAISSAAGTAGVWDFAIQLYHATTSDSFYTLQKRVSTGAGGLTTAVNSPIGTVGTYPTEVAFLIRVTDAGAESDTNFNSRVQVSVDGGTSWIYDTQTDTTYLPNGWRFPGLSRFVYWDIAGGAGPVTYDNFTLNWLSGPTTAPRTWSGGGGDNNWSTGANWGGVAPGTGDMLILNGTTRQTNTNDLSGLTVPWVAFNNGGFALYGNVLTNSGAITNLAGTNTFVSDLAWSSTAAKVWSLASGSEVLLNNANSVEVTGDHNIIGGGTLRLKGAMNIGSATTANPAFVVNEGRHVVDGGTFSSRGGYRIGSVATGSGAQSTLTNGASLTLTVSGANLRVGDSANPITSRLVIDHSTLSMAGGILYLPYAGGATGEVSQVGGTVSGCQLSFSSAGAGMGTYTIKDGTLEPYIIEEVTSGGNSRIYLDNAVLRAPSGATNVFMSGLNGAEIQSGGLTIDAQSDVVIAQDLSGAGALTKTGPSAVTLSGANTYAGNTLVNAGKLVLTTGQTYAKTIQVADYAELGVAIQTEGASLTNGTLNLGLSSLTFDLGSSGNPPAPLMTVTNLSANGAVTINIANALLLTRGQIVLVDYAGTIGGGGFNAFVKGNLPAGVSAELVNNTANSSIDLLITGVPGFIWTGAVSADWDTWTANWISQQTGLPSTYSEGFVTEFRDGATTGIVNLVSYPAPSAIIVSNDTLPYLWIGGAINTPLLKKNGPGSLTRAGGEADVVGVIELNAGSYVVSNSYDATFATVLTDTSAGTGSFVKQGSSTLTVTSSNSTYDGAVLIQQGTFRVGSDLALGATSGVTTIADGATLDVNNFTPGFEPVIVSGAGVNGQGAIIDSTTATGVDTTLRDVTMVGDTTLGSPNGGRWDIRVRQNTGPGPGLRGNGYRLTKVGSGSVSIACQRTTTGYWDMNLGDVFIQQGSLTFAEAVGLGNPSKTITIADGASLGTYDLQLTNPIARNIIMTNATISGGGSLTDTNVFTGTITMSGANTLSPNKDAVMIINGPMVGTASLTISGGGSDRVYLNAMNAYSGDTTLAGATLGGTGVIPGNLIVNDGTTSPGMDGVGTLTVNGSATLGGTNIMELNRSQTPNSDRLVVGGTLAFGGVLQVIVGAGAPAPQAGDVYQLFNRGSSSAFSTINLPDLSGLPGDLAWDTTGLAANGRLTVTGTATPPTIGTVSVNGGNLVLSGTGGIPGTTYYVVTSTNVADPLPSWALVASNVFSQGGWFSFTNNIVGGGPKAFYRVLVP